MPTISLIVNTYEGDKVLPRALRSVMAQDLTDVQVIVEYLNTPGKEAYAYPLMGMVGTCLFLQLLTVFMQTRKGAKAKMAKEMLIVLSGLKPAKNLLL